MATSKTLAPTNVTISIPAMTDQPNASVLANCADKEADAINALNSQLTTKNGTVTAAQSGSSVANFAVRQSGNVVTVNGYISGLTINANTYTHIATVSGISSPPYIVRARGAAGNNAYTTGNDAYIEMGTDEKIYVYAAGASNTVYVSFSYIV